MARHPHGFDPQHYVNTLQSHRASLAFRDEQYDRAHAAAARSPAIREFYANEATVDHRFGERRLVATRMGKPLEAP
jgi:hypothetical protein